MANLSTRCTPNAALGGGLGHLDKISPRFLKKRYAIIRKYLVHGLVRPP